MLLCVPESCKQRSFSSPAATCDAANAATIAQQQLCVIVQAAPRAKYAQARALSTLRDDHCEIRAG